MLTTESIAADAGNAEHYYRRADIYHYTRPDFDRAIADYTKAIELRPGYADAYEQRGWGYHKMGKKDLAERDWEKAK